MSKSHPAATTTGRTRSSDGKPKLRTPTRRPAAPKRLRHMYEDEDSFDVPDIAIGGAKE